jgi:hypothetical protein
MARVRKIESPDDIRPGTRKGKIDYDQVWMVKVKMPKRLMKNIDRGYNNLDKNKVRDMLTQGGVVASQPEPVEETPQGTANEEL